MKMRFLSFLLCAACVFCQPARAQDAAPVDLKELAALLKQIKDKRAMSEKASAARVVQDLRAAAASNATAIAFYEQAVWATQYDEKIHEHTEFQSWMRDEADKLKSEAMQNAARLHLNYLLLTFQRAGGATTRQLESALLAHIAALTAAGAGDSAIQARSDRAQALREAPGFKPVRGAKKPVKEPLFWEQDLINKGVDSSIFVQWYGVSKMLSNLKDWESSPGNVDGMYQKTLLPYYRENKDSRVIAYWDMKLQQEAQQATSSSLSFKIDQFNMVRRPQLLWKRAQDMILIGQRNRGIGEMVSLVKNYPDHQDFADWISTLEGILTGTATVSGAGPNTAPPESPTPQ